MSADEMTEGLDFERQMDDMLKLPDGQPRPDGQERLLKYVAGEVRYTKRTLTKLVAEHNEQMAKGGCAVSVTSGNPQQINVNNLPKGIIALASGISSGVTLILLIVVLVILWRIGVIG